MQLKYRGARVLQDFVCVLVHGLSLRCVCVFRQVSAQGGAAVGEREGRRAAAAAALGGRMFGDPAAGNHSIT